MTHLVLQEPFRAVFYAPFYATLQKGGLERRGLSVELVSAGSLETATQALLTGRVDVGWGGPMHLMLAQQSDPAMSLRYFGAAVVRDPFLLIGCGPNPRFRLEDLRHLRLATVSEVATPWWCLQDDLRRVGLDPTALHRSTAGSMTDNVAAMLAGDLDVVQVLEPLASAAEAEGASVWHAAACRGATAYTSFYTTTTRIGAKAEGLRHLRDAPGEVLAWIDQADAAEVAQCIAPFFPDTTPSMLISSLRRYQSLRIWGDASTRFPEGAVARLESAMLSAGAPRQAGATQVLAADLGDDQPNLGR